LVFSSRSQAPAWLCTSAPAPLRPWLSKALGPRVPKPELGNQIEQNQIEQNQIEQNQIEQNQIEQNQVEQNQVEQNQVEQNQVERRRAALP